jgi:hypothetical protein
MNKGKRIEMLIAERERLRIAWQANRKERGKIEMRPDKLTTDLSKAVGLEALLDHPLKDNVYDDDRNSACRTATGFRP